MDNNEMLVIEIIINAGEAKGYMYEALDKAKEGKFDEADALIEKAEETLVKAHDIQTSVLTREASGEKMSFSILFVHCQDHLMTCISEKKLIEELIDLRKFISK